MAKRLPQRPAPWRPQPSQPGLSPQSYSPSAEPPSSFRPGGLPSLYSPPAAGPGAAASLLGGVGGPTFMPGVPMLQRYTAGLGTAPDIGTSGDRVRQIADLIRGQAGPAASPSGTPLSSTSPTPSPQPSPAVGGAVDPRIPAMDAMSDYWRNLSKKFKPAAGAKPQQPGAAAMLQGQSPPATPQLGATPQFAPQRTVSPETEASVNTMLRPPLNPVAAQYLNTDTPGTPYAGVGTASEIERRRFGNEAARNRIASLPTAGERGDAMAPGLGLPTIAERIATGQRQPGYSDTLEGRRLKAVPARFLTPARQPTPNPDTAGTLAGQAADREKQGYLAQKRRRDEEQFSTSAETLLGITPRESGPYSRDRLRQRVSDARGAQRKTVNIATNTAAEEAGRPQDIVNILSGRLQSQVDAERRKREAKRLSVLEYRKTGEPVTPEMVELRQGLAADLLAGLQPQDYLSTAARAEGAGGRYGRLGPLLTAGAQIHAGQQKEEADRGIMRENMALQERIAAITAGRPMPQGTPPGVPTSPGPTEPYMPPGERKRLGGAAAGLMGKASPSPTTPGKMTAVTPRKGQEPSWWRSVSQYVAETPELQVNPERFDASAHAKWWLAKMTSHPNLNFGPTTDQEWADIQQAWASNPKAEAYLRTNTYMPGWNTDEERGVIQQLLREVISGRRPTSDSVKQYRTTRKTEAVRQGQQHAKEALKNYGTSMGSFGSY